MGSKLLPTTSLGLSLILLFAINIASNVLLDTVRIDLTENKLYTLSAGTRNILSSLDEPVTLRLYVSKSRITSIPALAGYADRIESMLSEYQRLSAGLLSVHSIDPEPFSEQEDRAVAYGMRGLPIAGGDLNLYFGIVGTNSVGVEESIPVFSLEREAFLEYDLTRLIYKLTDPKQPLIGLVSSLPMLGSEPQGAAIQGISSPQWAIVDQIQQLFKVQSLPLTLDQVPADIDILILVHPQQLSDATLYAIDQYVLRGGRVLAFVDGYSESQPQMHPGAVSFTPSRQSQIDKLLAAWGVELVPNKIVADIQHAVAVQMQQENRVISFDYPLWLNIGPDYFDPDDPITANLGNMTFGSPGMLTVRDNATTQVSSLIRTSMDAALFDLSELIKYTNDPRQLLDQYQPLGKALNLAVRVTGPINSAFPDGQPAVEDAQSSSSEAPEDRPEVATSDPPHLVRSVADVNLIIVADADFLSDRFWVRVQDVFGSRIAIPSAANGAFVTNALDNLTGSGDLISVRNRGSFIRPFDRIDKLRKETEAVYRQKEQELAQQLQDTEDKLIGLEEEKQSGIAGVFSEKQRTELKNFRQQRLRIRKELRTVRLDLQRSIKTLEDRLKFINIGLVPLLIGIGGITIGTLQMRRRKRHALQMIEKSKKQDAVRAANAQASQVLES